MLWPVAWDSCRTNLKCTVPVLFQQSEIKRLNWMKDMCKIIRYLTKKQKRIWSVCMIRGAYYCGSDLYFEMASRTQGRSSISLIHPYSAMAEVELSIKREIKGILGKSWKLLFSNSSFAGPTEYTPYGTVVIYDYVQIHIRNGHDGAGPLQSDACGNSEHFFSVVSQKYRRHPRFCTEIERYTISWTSMSALYCWLNLCNRFFTKTGGFPTKKLNNQSSSPSFEKPCCSYYVSLTNCTNTFAEYQEVYRADFNYYCTRLYF